MQDTQGDESAASEQKGVLQSSGLHSRRSRRGKAVTAVTALQTVSDVFAACG
jgi:hypothetical protein